MAALVGCSDPGYDPDGGRILLLDITSDQPVDTIRVVPAQYGIHDQPGIATPALVAAGTTPAPGTIFSVPGVLGDSFDPPTQSDEIEIDAVFSSYVATEYLVLGYRNGAVVSAGVLVPDLSDQWNRKNFPIAIDATLLPSLELWGSRDDQLCARLDGPTPQYLVDDADQDCDGFPDTDDCNPTIYCDPTKNDPASQAACMATSCEPCEELTGCTIQSRAVCQNITGLPRQLTCDSGGSCGPAACLPADACALDCSQPWPDTDPTICLAENWTTGTQRVDSTVCQLPTTNHKSCSGGSTIEVALPFTGCANPHVVVANPFDQTVSAVVIAPCTLRVVVVSQDMIDPMPVIVSLDTDTTRATIRLELDPTDGACAGPGTCEAVVPASTCQL